MRRRSVLSAMVCGVLTKDAQVKTFQDGFVSAWLFIDVLDEKSKDQHVEKVKIDYRLWKPTEALMEFVANNFVEGARVLVKEGKLRSQLSLDDDGNPQSVLRVTTEEVVLLDLMPKKEKKTPSASTTPSPAQEASPPPAVQASPAPPKQERVLRAVPAAATPPVTPAEALPLPAREAVPAPTSPAPAAQVYDAVPFDQLATWSD